MLNDIYINIPAATSQCMYNMFDGHYGGQSSPPPHAERTSLTLLKSICLQLYISPCSI